MPIIPTGLYPSLEAIMSLFRNLVNDDVPGATNTLGEGAIATDVSAFTLNFLNSAIRDLYSDLRIVGAPALIRDNIIISGITPVNGANGPGAQSPDTQVNISATGYFDGYQMNNNILLPADLIAPEKLWERESGTADEFRPMVQAPSMYPRTQNDTFGEWEWRGDAIWLHGALTTRDLRLRYQATIPDFFGPNIDFTNTFVPIYNCGNAIAAKLATLYAIRIAPEREASSQAREDRLVKKLVNEIVLASQAIPNMRQPFGAR